MRTNEDCVTQLVDHLIISSSPTDHIVNAAHDYSNVDPMDEEREKVRKLREAMAKQKIFQKTLGPNNDELDPDPERRLALERTIQYSEIQDCPFCKEQIVYRTSNTIYSPTRGTDRSVLTDFSYPDYLPISVKTTERDRFGNFQDMFGKNTPHRCNIENFTKEELAKYIEHLNEQNVEFNKWVFQQLRLLRKQVVFKDIWIDRD